MSVFILFTKIKDWLFNHLSIGGVFESSYFQAKNGKADFKLFNFGRFYFWQMVKITKSVVVVFLSFLLLLQFQLTLSSQAQVVSDDPVVLRSVWWIGRSYIYDREQRKYLIYNNVDHDDWQLWQRKQCPTVADSGVLTHSCNRAITKANGRRPASVQGVSNGKEVFALRVRYFVPYSDPNSVIRNGQPTNGVFYTQIFYTYYDSDVYAYPGFAPWFAYQPGQGDDWLKLTGEEVPYNSLNLRYIARYY